MKDSGIQHHKDVINFNIQQFNVEVYGSITPQYITPATNKTNYTRYKYCQCKG
jgi:hypothetical protein